MLRLLSGRLESLTRVASKLMMNELAASNPPVSIPTASQIVGASMAVE